MSTEKNSSIMTPVFNGTRYLHHVCSECKGTITLAQYRGVFFYYISGDQCSEVKFCPLCGSEVIRFSDKPIYETPIDLTPLDVFRQLQWEYEDKAKWLYHCYISEKHRDQIEALVSLVNKTELGEGYQKAIELARKADIYGALSHHTMRKLRKKFGEETE